MPLNAVLDTNIWVSYFINARADYLAKYILEHDIKVFTSDELVEELREVLQRPKFKLLFPVNDFIELHLSVCTKVNVSLQFNESPDPDDNFLFDLCIKSKTDYLVTADKRLLNFIPYFDLKIITFNEWRNIVE
jgi:uncharacterized protein